MSKINENKNDRANLFYFNNTINDYDLPENLSSFISDIKELFQIDSRLNEEINLTYIFLDKDKNKKTKEKIIEIKSDDDYKKMKERLTNEIKDQNILIEIENNSNNILERKAPETFEEEIQNIVERELKNAGERIIKYLSSNDKKSYPSSKIQDKICSECNNIISGDIYKSAKNVEEKYYCENCSFNINDPMFVIH